MTAATLQQIGDILTEIGTPDTFSAKRTRPAEDLRLVVKGVGPLRFPVSRRQAQQLCRIGRPARYGQGEKTLLDRSVRDTWQIPKSRVKIDLRRWKKTLLPVLEQLAADLGMSAGCRLKPELHALLVYAPGQFFLPHQDEVLSRVVDRLFSPDFRRRSSPLGWSLAPLEFRSQIWPLRVRGGEAPRH